ncbi:MAG: LuxR C-terminal-related transcriptional regulator [Bacillota bacterium]
MKDPEGIVVGYLDISLHAEKELGLAAAHLQALVNLIEKELYLRELKAKLQQTGVRLPPILALPPEVERELTPREREVLQLRLSGLTTTKIAKELCIGVSTVKTHCEHIYKKLGVNNLSEPFSKLFDR